MNVLRIVDNVFPPQLAFAHCDVPCGIYDPHEAQVSAHTIIRMTMLINDLKASSDQPDFEERKKIISQVARLTKVKEDHAELLKGQIRVIWGDYFKPEHIEKHKGLHDLVFKIMKQASKVRQEVNLDEALALLGNVQKFSEMFWETKDRNTVRVKSGYPTEGEIVQPA